DEAAVKDLMARTVQHFGGLDILVNNAGIALFKPIDELSAAEFARVLDVNLKGPWLCAKYAFPALKRHGGVIINITSASGHYGGASAGGRAHHAPQCGLRQPTYPPATDVWRRRPPLYALAPRVT